MQGQEPCELHTHFDAGGNVTGSTLVERDPEYDEEQYNLAVALHVYESGLGAHGQPLAETMSPDADPDNPDGKYRYEVLPPMRDWFDYAIEMEQKKPEWSGDNYLSSRKFTAVRRDRTNGA